MSNEPVVPTFILEDDGLFREGLRLILSRTCFRPQCCGIELDDLGALPCDKPFLVIVRVGPSRDFICKRIRTRCPLSFIVAVGDESSAQHLKSALDEGANAAIFSSIMPRVLVSSLHTVTSGQITVIDARLWSTEIELHLDRRFSLPAQTVSQWDPVVDTESHVFKQLSAREIAILDRIVRGDSNKHVARHFKIAEPTVKAHVKAIFRKIGVTNRTQAAIWAMNHRLNVPSDTAELVEHLEPLAQDLDGAIEDKGASAA
ncbi:MULTISPECIES: response regulator transcription factor [unclassified Bradyrhizobium]|uniref:response regulator transcription factor n=1 Tax=unclassified Bradyrhizobium TaxID=2631580 RepID=UPI002479F22D|nr:MULTISPECIES: response regulator transcription factor [unclassified Bradyrhizobium]WGR68693.1 response regulator transcription factor [Bradyrhizobium sp. ISRA426]WGR80748.1 response regulator transcription factor [Bradyrhizobium sp. ISRA430]WGR83933.1 response regulator transcription factor [Bradyrhizobium sp. ISRA432]